MNSIDKYQQSFLRVGNVKWQLLAVPLWNSK
jgi:hypothetical protein